MINPGKNRLIFHRNLWLSWGVRRVISICKWIIQRGSHPISLCRLFWIPKRVMRRIRQPFHPLGKRRIFPMGCCSILFSDPDVRFCIGILSLEKHHRLLTKDLNTVDKKNWASGYLNLLRKSFIHVRNPLGRWYTYYMCICIYIYIYICIYNIHTKNMMDCLSFFPLFQCWSSLSLPIIIYNYPLE